MAKNGFNRKTVVLLVSLVFADVPGQTNTVRTLGFLLRQQIPHLSGARIEPLLPLEIALGIVAVARRQQSRQIIRQLIPAKR